MSENELCGPSKAIVGKARKKGFVKGKLTVVPELLEGETLLFTFVAKAIRERVDSKDHEELDMQEICNLFTFIYAKGGEAAFNWHSGNDFTISPRGIFDQAVPFSASPDMIEYYNAKKLPEEMFEAFHHWVINEPSFCIENAVHPLIPLLDALKWTYRISLGMGLEYLGYK
ncbi:MAG: hypothetical protein A2020_10065 [Lentisphaerae bacterium GWF2_45_14]|nr:MAG: hypothetical protein A2020_10065 [Lentisphaerae bacterium GWF2_45_14]